MTVPVSQSGRFLRAQPSREEAEKVLSSIRNSAGPSNAVPNMELHLYTSSFCAACASTRAVVEQALSLVDRSAVPVTLTEVNVALSPDAAEDAHILATPTVVFENARGEEVFRAEGVPTLNQVLGGLALAI